MADNEYIAPIGAEAQRSFATADLGLNATAFALSATVNGNLISGLGAKNIAVSVTATEAGNAVLNGYLDAAGTILAWTVTVALTAATAAVASYTGGIPWQTAKLSYTNTNATAGTVTANAGLVQG